VVPGVVQDGEEGGVSNEEGSLSGGCLDRRRVPVVFSVSAWAQDEFHCRLVPERGSNGEIFLVLARLGCAFDVDAIDVEVAGTGAVGCRTPKAKALAEGLTIGFPPGFEDVDGVSDDPAVDGLCRCEEGVEELGELVGAYGRGKGVPEDGVDLFEAKGGVRDVEDAGDRDGLGVWCGSF
jgi:hypothetical protein